MQKILGIAALCTLVIIAGSIFFIIYDSDPQNVNNIDDETSTSFDSPIKITLSHTLNDIIFDGEWSFKQEWKTSSLNEFRYGGNDLILRSAHQDNYIYILIDVLGDVKDDHMKDRAIVCFDGKETSNMADTSDWCYMASRGSNNAYTLNGGSPIHRTSHFNIQKNHPDFIGIGGTSGENDRYSRIPHAAYEFKIPIEQIGFEDEYGFFIQVFDDDVVMTYPQKHSGKYPQKIPSPEQWGLMISPDHSITSEHFNQN